MMTVTSHLAKTKEGWARPCGAAGAPPRLSAVLLFALIVAFLFPLAMPAQNTQAAPQSARLQSEMSKVYLEEARVKDLLSLLETANWKVTDAQKASFREQIGAISNQAQTLEKWRYLFLYHPQQGSYGRNIVETLEGLIPEMQKLGDAAAKYQNAAAGAQFNETADDLAKLKEQVSGYLAAVFPGEIAPAGAAHPAAPAMPVTGEAASPRASSSGNVTSAPATAHEALPVPPAGPGQPASSAPPAEAAAVSIPAVPAKHLDPSQVKALLMKVYFATARLKDLLSLTQPGTWKMTDTERADFDKELQSVQTGLTTLEKWRNQFYYQLSNTGMGDKTVEAITGVLPRIKQVVAAAGQFQGPSAAAQFAPAQKELVDLEAPIASYVAYLHAQYRQELAAVPAGAGKLETERISATAAPPPARYVPILTPPLTDAQVKAILYQIYVSVFRIRDLLSQEQPESWKAPKTERDAEALARATLLSRAGELEKWRGLFSEYPDSMYYAFQTYRSVEDLFQPLDAFSRGVSRYRDPRVASNYTSEASDLRARLDGLLPYISFILRHESNSIALYESDLAACQSKLSYAMHGLGSAPVAMRNIVPDFQGRRVRRRKSDAHARPHATKKAARSRRRHRRE